MPGLCLASHLPAASGSGFCLSNPSPAAPLGGGQARAWVVVSLAGPHFPLYPSVQLSVPCSSGALSCRKACLLAGWPVTSPTAGATAIFLCSALSGLLNRRQQAAGSGLLAPWEP